MAGKLQVTELDFDNIKTNLKTYLKGQSEFSDYNFEGSGLSTLVDLLAYNTHYLAMNANYFTNEMFLDTATSRDSVVSHAKELGYTPRSARAPKAFVDISVPVVNPNITSVTMSKGTRFTTNFDGTTYGFLVNEDITSSVSGSRASFVNVPIYEGTLATAKYTVDSNNPDKKYLITSNRADTTTLKVSVQTSATDTRLATYKLATELTNVTATSQVYFLQEEHHGEFEVYFGDNVLGQGLVDGNIVILEYIVTNQAEANGATLFSAPSIGGQSGASVTTIADATGGDVPETIQSIKYYAPLNYTAQNRAVTAFDYKALIPKVYPNVKSIQVWGGEDNDPPVYGQVYVSLTPTAGTTLTQSQKANIVSDLKQYNIASVRPVIVDPEIAIPLAEPEITIKSSPASL